MRYSTQRTKPIHFSNNRAEMLEVAARAIAEVDDAEIATALQDSPPVIRSLIESETRSKIAAARKSAQVQHESILREMQTLQKAAAAAFEAVPVAAAKLAKAREKAAALLSGPASEYNEACIQQRAAQHQVEHFCMVNAPLLLPQNERTALRNLIERLGEQLRVAATGDKEPVEKKGLMAALHELLRVQNECGMFLNSGELPPADLTEWIADALCRIGAARDGAEALERKRMLFEHNALQTS